MKKTLLALLILITALAVSSCDENVKSDENTEQQDNQSLNASESAEAKVAEEALELKHTLRFDDSGNFKVLVFSDVHATETLEGRTKAGIDALIAKEEPDLVLFNGDLVYQPSDIDALRSCVESMSDYCEKNQIPWAHVYGNHDSEASPSGASVSREEQQKIYEAFEWCISKRGPENISGVGNYVLPVLRSDSDKIAFNIWGLDSGSYLNDIIPGLEKQAVSSINSYTYNSHNYAYIPFNQIAWYYNTSVALEKYNGEKIPAMMFFHIPICEYHTVVNNQRKTGMVGNRQEDVCSSELNSGMFTAALERGDVKMFVAGHDHINDFCGEYCGIKLAYDASIGYQSYHDTGVMGCRVVEISQAAPDEFTTHMSYLGDIEGWNLRSDVEQRETAGIGDAPFAGDVLDAEDYTAEEFTKSSHNILFNDDRESVDGNYYSSNFNDGGKAAGVTILVEDGKGFDGGAAFQIIKKYDRSNSEFTLYLKEPVTIGDAGYLRVWVDFTGIDFRKASFGLAMSDGALYRTDENDSSNKYLDMYYLPEGETKWQVFSHGSDGCFGDAEEASVLDFKGWLAFPLADMYGYAGNNGGYGSITKTAPDSSLTVSGIYFYFDLLTDNMLRAPFYFDQLGLVADYSSFDK